MFGFRVEPQPPVDFFYENGPDRFRFGNYGGWALHTPGHCPGGVCLAIGRIWKTKAGAELIQRLACY